MLGETMTIHIIHKNEILIGVIKLTQNLKLI